MATVTIHVPATIALTVEVDEDGVEITRSVVWANESDALYSGPKATALLGSHATFDDAQTALDFTYASEWPDPTLEG